MPVSGFLPLWDSFGVVIKTSIAAVPLWSDCSVLHGLKHRAAGLFQMRTVLEPAGTNIRTKLPESILQLFTSDRFDQVNLKGRKSGRVSYIGIISKIIELDMACRMSATTELVADRSGRQSEIRTELIKNAGFSYA